MEANGFTATYATLADLGTALRGTCYDSAELVGRLRNLTVPAEAFGTRRNARFAHQACSQTVRTETDRIYRQTQVLGDVTGGVEKGLAGYRGFSEGWAKKLSAEEAELQRLQPGGH
ncbi:hypothetical protein [Actinophytocola sp.]|uniref:hypothetical protein n=1 Tax=Actinophytocola sp. TaxID=1872138 RepID=UPI002ED66996